MVYVSTVISGAASLGVLIGLITGIFFLVLTALKWVSRVRASLYEEELQRQKRILINNSYLSRAGTSNFLDSRKIENDFGSTLNGNIAPTIIEENFQGNAESQAHLNEYQTDLKAPEKDPNADTIKVREAIEKMVEKMIGGPLDGTTVGQLSSHPAYLDVFTKYHNLLCRELARLGFALHLSVVRNNAFEVDPTDSKQFNLKRLIKRIISEAMALPNINDILLLQKTSKETGNDDFKNKSYEDILATAILNKIIGNYQNKNYNEKEIVDGDAKPRLRNKKLRRNDDNDKSDDDWSDTSRSDQLSLTVEEYIEEVTTTLEVSDDENSDLSDFETTTNRRIPFPESGRTVVDAGTDDENSDYEDQNTATELITSTSSWEENWLFQKKRLRSTPNAHHPVPVPMLVPNPSEDYRALVGGVDADDLSDMSDCTDSVLEDLITTETLPTQTQTSETAQKNSEECDMQQTETMKVSLCENNQDEILDIRIPGEVENHHDEASKGFEEYSVQEAHEDVEENTASPTSPDAFSQKDRESSFQDFSHQYEPVNSHSPTEGATENSTSIESDDCARCPVAEREKEKWKNPVSLVENPYSLENIEKREKRKKNEYFRIGTYTGESIDFPEGLSSDTLFPSKQESEKLRFSRDYYVNASKHPSGISPPCNQHSEVSRHSYEAMGRRTVERNSKPSLYQNTCDDSARYFTPNREYKNLFLPFQSQTIGRQHFSEVFKTSNTLNDDPPNSKTCRKYRYGSHSLKLRPKVKETILKPSLDQELSDFEQKSLREDLKHSLLRAKGASPNFILNPVFKADIVTKSSKIEPKSAPLSDVSRDPESFTNDESGGESGLCKSEPVVSLYRQESGENTSRAYEKVSRVSQESGYGSDSLDYSSDSLEYWRLTPPKTPEVVESSFVSIVKNRKNKENLRKLRNSLSSFY